MTDLVIRGGVVTPDRILEDGWVAVSDGRIEAIGDGSAPNAAETHDVTGDQAPKHDL